VNLFDHHFIDLEGNRLYLDRHRNQPFLIVNIATESLYTPQLARLQSLYALNQASGLRVLAIPCTDFGDEPRDEAGIAEFLRENYPLNFFVTQRYAVTGREMHPLFRELVQEHSASILPRQTFHKFLFDRRGQLAENWPPTVLPDDPGLVNAVQKHLTSKSL
jgi:glutathione peroxidase